MTSQDGVADGGRRIILSRRIVLIAMGLAVLFAAMALNMEFHRHEKTLQKKVIIQDNFSFTAALQKDRSGRVYVYLKERRWFKRSWILKELLYSGKRGLDANSTEIVFDDTRKVITFRIENTTKSYVITPTGPVSCTNNPRLPLPKTLSEKTNKKIEEPMQ